MAELNWTPSQESAINAKDRTLLVSAAAGSGKTAVLTERIIKNICEGTADINRLVIVTFTNAAAKELKARITKRLSEELKNDPANTRLARQLSSVGTARISTIHSFCIDVIKRNFDKLGLPCGIRIAEESEIKLLKIKIMNAMFDDLYDENSPFEGFERFTDCFITDQDDALPTRFLSLYDSLCSRSEGIDFISSLADRLAEDKDKPFLTTLHGTYLRMYTEAFLDSYVEPSKKILSILEGSDKSYKRYVDEYQRILDEVELIKKALKKGDYPTVQSLFKHSTPIRMVKTNIDSDFSEATQIKEVRNAYKKEVAAFYSDYYSDSEEQIRKCYEDTESIYRSLYRLLSSFNDRFREEKLKRKIMDFNDTERYVLELFLKDGRPTETAKAYGELFDEIYIDEYQDINQLQDDIFTAISGTSHRFMVGDIKQSIYGFRGSEPKIFADYRDAFPVYDEKTEDSTGTIFLSNNFRCSENIIKFCNTVCGKLMSNIFDGVPYLEEDDLVYSKKEEKQVKDPVEVILVERGSELSEEQVVARRIKELIDEGHSPSDIVILLRKTKNKVEAYEEALKELNIPYFNSSEGGFFANPEILLMLCLLNVIDNPRRDIYLAGALQSPIFGFSLDDMIEVRRYDRGGYLYDSLLKWYEATENPKARYFLETVEDMRAHAAGSPIDELIWYIYSKTSMLSLSYGETGGEERRANLLMLYEYARSFESGSFKGLYNFILYINNLIENEARVGEAKTNTDATPTVKISTIHHSKGLEFPICFVSGCGTTYLTPNTYTVRDELTLDPLLGIAVYTPEENGLCRINGILRRIIKIKAVNDQAAEELRLLYVALTRARDRLIVTGKCTSSAENLTKNCKNLMHTFSPYTVSSCNSFITLIRLALLYAPNDPCYALSIEHAPDDDAALPKTEPALNDAEDTPDLPATDNIAEQSEEYSRLKALFTERFSFRYAHSAAAELPSKMAVSRLYPGVLDEDDTQTPTAPMLVTPRFLEGEVKSSGAQRGTATHVFMQFCDFDNVVNNGVDAEIDRLIKKRFIPEGYANMIRRDTLKVFFSSPLFSQMRKSPSLNRETRFNICLPASSFTEDSELKATLAGDSVLVQGVMDCFFEDENGEVVIVDYKTDTFTEEQKKDIVLCEQKLRERHGTQLGYYRLACRQLLGKDPKKSVIWSFDLGKEVEI